MFSLMRGRGGSSDTLGSDGGSTAGQSGPSGAFQALKNLNRLPEPTDPDYVSLKASTDALADALESALASAKSVDGAWLRLSAEQVAFAEAVHRADRHSAASAPGAGAPAEGIAAARALGKAAAALNTTQGVGPASNGGRTRNAAHTVALEQVRRFLAHLRAVQARYRDVWKAKAEFESCAGKAASLRARSGASANQAARAKVTAANEKRDQAEKMYFAMLGRLVERMRAAMERKEEVIALVNNAFWLQQARIQAQMGQLQESAYDAARATEPLLVSSNIMLGLSSPASMFTALDIRGRSRAAPKGALDASQSCRDFRDYGRKGSGGGSGGDGGGGGGGGGLALPAEQPRAAPRRKHPQAARRAEPEWM